MRDGRRITASFGVVLLQENEELHGAMKRADDLLYRAKALGRNAAVNENEGVLRPVSSFDVVFPQCPVAVSMTEIQA